MNQYDALLKKARAGQLEAAIEIPWGFAARVVAQRSVAEPPSWETLWGIVGPRALVAALGLCFLTFVWAKDDLNFSPEETLALTGSPGWWSDL
jgi:hypothetical protein